MPIVSQLHAANRLNFLIKNVAQFRRSFHIQTRFQNEYSIWFLVFSHSRKSSIVMATHLMKCHRKLCQRNSKFSFAKHRSNEIQLLHNFVAWIMLIPWNESQQNISFVLEEIRMSKGKCSRTQNILFFCLEKFHKQYFYCVNFEMSIDILLFLRLNLLLSKWKKTIYWISIRKHGFCTE